MIAQATEGYTGAELVALVHESTLRWFGGQREGYNDYSGFLLGRRDLVKPQQNGKTDMQKMRETVESRGWQRANQADQAVAVTASKGRKLKLSTDK